jgi:hypothetical protein
MSDHTKWCAEDFRINKAFWASYPNSAAKPIRHANLALFFAIVPTSTSALFGKTLKNSVECFELLNDHDDDIITTMTKDTVKDLCLKAGFNIIRESDQYISIERFNRYIDIHFTNDNFTSSAQIVDGQSYPVPSFYQNYLQEKYYKRPGNRIGVFFEKAARGIRKPKQSFKTIIKKAVRTIRSTPKTSKSSEISEQEFLNLKIERDEAINWTWRISHMKPFLEKNEKPKVYEIIEKLRLEKSSKFVSSIIETDNSSAHLEPIHLNKRFWSAGNNYYYNPYAFGYRHNVMPYLHSNLYINTINKPNLFGSDYYRSLTPMSDDEIMKFLAKSPIEIQSGSICSGRHRVYAMIGRIVRGEKYIPMYRKC